jgi:hypothetical protein
MPADISLALVAESPLFRKQIAIIRSRYPRIDDYIDGVKWVLERSPREGKRLSEPLASYRVIENESPFTGVPGIWLAYSLKGNKVTLADIKVVGEQDLKSPRSTTHDS